MEQNAFAGRDVQQIGRDFTLKVFGLNMLNQNVSHVNILNPDDSEIKAYLSYWDGLTSEQRISIVLNCRKYIKENYKLKKTLKVSHRSSKKLFFILFLLLFLTVQFKGNREALLKNEYMVFSTVTSKYCEAAKDALLPLPTCSNSNYKDKNPENDLKNKFEDYKYTWFEFTVSCLIIPWLVTKLLLGLIGFPLEISRNYQQKNEEKTLEMRNDLVLREKRAKEQTYNILFNLLDESEKLRLRDEEEAFLIQEIKDEMQIFFSNPRLIISAKVMESIMPMEVIADNAINEYPTLSEDSKAEIKAHIMSEYKAAKAKLRMN